MVWEPVVAGHQAQPGGTMSTDQEMVLLRSFGYRHEAEFACAALDGAGIDHRLMADDAGGAHPGLGFANPPRVFVRREDVDAATEVLREHGLT
jgi:hypothetical protein